MATLSFLEAQGILEQERIGAKAPLVITLDGAAMAHFDLTLAELERYLPEREEPADFDDFWRGTISAQGALPPEAEFTEIESGYTELITFDVTFAGFGGHPIKGWFLLPRHRTGPLPVVVSYLGYGGGRGVPGSWTGWPSAGIAQFVMDSRGQGSGYRPGDTPDGALTGPHSGGVMTLGIDAPESYYYRRLFTDAVRAVEVAANHPRVDPERVVVAGGSQGGGIALAVAGLSARPLAGALIDVPFLCHYRRAITLVDTAPYAELVRYLRIHRHQEDRVLATLDYFDGLHFAARATAPALFSVGLMDQVCPPSTVYAAYNHYAGAKEMAVYPFNGHENGEEVQTERQLRFLERLLGR